MPRIIPPITEFGGFKSQLPQNNNTVSGEMANNMGRWCALNFLNDVSCSGKTGNPLAEGQVLTFSGGSWINYFSSGSSANNTFISSSDADSTHSNVTFTYNNGSSFSMTNAYSLFSDRIVTGGTFYSNTDIITFRTNSGTTFNVSGFSIYDNYWSADTTNFIRVTGGTMGIKVGGDVNTSGSTHIKKNLFISGGTYATSDVFVDEFIYHNGDNDTYLKFKNTDDTVNLVAGGWSAIRFEKSTGKIVINNTNEDADFHVMAEDGTEILATDAANNKVGVNTTTPNEALTVVGNISGNTNLYISGITTSTGGFIGDLVGTATTATTVLVTDNESVNDNNLIAFVGNGVTTTGAQSLQMDGDLHYNPSIGRLTVPLTLQMPDGATIKLGDSQDLKLYHDGDDSYIKENGTGDLIIQTNSNVIIEGTGGENCAVFVDEGGVELYYDNTRRFQTTSDGISAFTAHIRGELGVSGATHIKKTLFVSGDTYITGDIYSGTTNLLDLFTGGGGSSTSYWSGSTAQGNAIINSGLTTGVGIGTDTPTGLFEVKDLIKFPEINSTFIGVDAGLNWEANSTSGTALGRLAMGVGTMNAAVQNTAIGFASIANITTGDKNTAVGLQSNTSNSTGSENTTVGTTAMFSNIKTNYNTAVGANTLYFTTSGSLGYGVDDDTYNTAIGYSSQYFSINGRWNTSVGAKTIGNDSISYGGSGNTAMGFEAMKSSKTAHYNTTFGFQAGDNITTGSYNISIGPSSDPPSATADYQLNIGNILYGKDLASSSSINAIGIGTNSPSYKLEVSGNIGGTADLGISGATDIAKNLRVSGNTQISGNTALGGLSGDSVGTLSVVNNFGNDYYLWRTQFGIGKGSGDILKFGKYSNNISAVGQVVILKNASGVPAWYKADARNPATYYIENMIGVTLDTYDGGDVDKTATILIKGFVRVPTALWNGSAANNTTGRQVYVSPDSNGEWTDEVSDFDTTNDVMRGLGHVLQYESTSPASYFIYFNPDQNFIKITV